MSNKRRIFSAEFKARIALDALSGEHTLSELTNKYGVHPNQISTWKKQAGGISLTLKAHATPGQHPKELNARQIEFLRRCVGKGTAIKLAERVGTHRAAQVAVFAIEEVPR